MVRLILDVLWCTLGPGSLIGEFFLAEVRSGHTLMWVKTRAPRFPRKCRDSILLAL